MSRYVAEFRVENIGQEESRQPRETNETLDKGSKIDTKAVGKVLTTGVALAMTTSRIYAQYEAAGNAIVGDAVSQRQFDNRMAYLNEGLQVFGSLGIAAIINPATAVAVGGALAVSYALRSYQVGQENRVRQASFMVERVVNEQRQQRLVKDITGVRI